MESERNEARSLSMSDELIYWRLSFRFYFVA